MGDKEFTPKDQNKSSETSLCRVSDEIIQVQGWGFLVPQQYIMMDTFSCPLCVIFKTLYEFCQFRIKISFLRLLQSEKQVGQQIFQMLEWV